MHSRVLERSSKVKVLKFLNMHLKMVFYLPTIKNLIGELVEEYIAVTAHVHDKIVLTGMGSMDIPVSDLGKPEDLLKIKKMDRLPYLIQKKTFLSLTQPFEDAGLVRIYN